MFVKHYRPSQANYWGNCAAFQRFTEHFVEEPPGDAAREGTCAAWVADVALKGEIAHCNNLIGETHSNGWIVNEQIAGDVQEYVDLISTRGGSVLAEEHIVANNDPRIEGTLDSSISQVTNRILEINDLKYGHRIVEVRGNRQLICYAWGKFITLPTGSVDEIHLSIYQPRGFHKDGIYRTWTLTPLELQNEFSKLLTMAQEGQKPDSLATPGSHCYECDAAAGCEALAHTTYHLVNVIHSRNQRDMTPQEVSRELDFFDEAMPTINARFKAVQSEAEARVKKESIPGWNLQPRKGHRVFTVPPGLNLSTTNIHLLSGIDPTELKLCTPAELIRRNADPEIVKRITKQPVTGHKLTRITNDDIAKIFDTTKGS